MLNRRILRIKVFKSLYAAVQTRTSSSPATLQDALSHLKQSNEAVRDLYLFMLGVVSPLTKVAADRLESAKGKAHPSEEDLHPNTKFADNALAVCLDENEAFQKEFKKRKYSWDQYDLVLKKVLNSVVTKDWYQRYMAASGRSLKEDCKLFTRIFEEEFVDLPELGDLLEEMSIWWNDDLAYALTWCCRTFSDLASGKDWELPFLYQSQMLSRKGAEHIEDDEKFANKLLEFAFTHFDAYSDRIASITGGWEKDRLVLTDICLVVCALSECVCIPGIPLRVSMNEYVEIAKYYGSAKSSLFVNGVLDRLVKQLQESGEIKKK
ncbi:MAG: hypothetical protein J6Y32_05520 [Bacteroidales bacterium]|nr:hypothetical protein [Bacteroidales bacterium]